MDDEGTKGKTMAMCKCAQEEGREREREREGEEGPIVAMACFTRTRGLLYAHTVSRSSAFEPTTTFGVTKGEGGRELTRYIAPLPKS